VAEVIVTADIFKGILTIINKISGRNDRKNDKVDQALFALFTAIVVTRGYADKLSNGNVRNRNQELAIAELWDKASIPLRHIDKDFASKCCDKGNYWLNSEIWTTEDIDEKGITLDKMEAMTRDLLLHQ